MSGSLRGKHREGGDKKQQQSGKIFVKKLEDKLDSGFYFPMCRTDLGSSETSPIYP